MIEKEQIFDAILINFVYNSEAIEGCKATLEDVKNIIHKGYSKNYNNYGEFSSKHIITHYALANKIIRLNSCLHIADIKLFHSILFDQIIIDAGNFRTCNAMIGGSNAVLVKSQYIYKMMYQFLDEYNDNESSTKYRDLYHVGLRHYRFEKIHPFSDGNGRIGRLIMLHDLYRNALPITMIKFEYQQDYYRALSESEEEFAGWYSESSSSFYSI